MAEKETQSVFLECCLRLKELEKAKSDTNDIIKNLNYIIDDLNSLEYDVIFRDSQEAEDLLSLVARLMPVGNDHILSKFCHFLSNVIHKQKISLSVDCLHSLMEFIINTIHCCGSWVLIDVLSSLAVLLYENVGRLEKFFESLVGQKGFLLNLAGPAQRDIDIQYAALKCLQCLTLKKPGELYLTDDQLLSCSQMCISILCNYKSLNVDNIAHCKILGSTLKCLQNMFTWKNIPVQNFGELLGSLKVLLYHGLPGQGSLVSTCLYPTLMCHYIPVVEQQIQENSGSFSRLPKQNKKTRRNRSRKKQSKTKMEEKEARKGDDDEDVSDSGYASASNIRTSFSSSFKFHGETATYSNWSKSSSSDSEFSDTEAGQAAKIRSLQMAVRQCAFAALQAVVRGTDKKQIFGYWSSFLPDSPVISGIHSQNILTSILKDPSPQVRFGALALLTDMLRGSKQFLSLADESSSCRTSFTPISHTLADMIKELHRCLLLALIAENSSSLLTQILKCYAVLVDNVPYKRLNADLLLKLLKHLRPFLSHIDLQVQVACLTVIGSIINVQPIPKEVISQIIEPSSTNRGRDKQNHLTDNTYYGSKNLESSDEYMQDKGKECLPWLVVICKNNIINGTPPLPLPLRLESLQVLGIFVGRYFYVIRQFMTFLEELVTFCLEDSDFFLQLHGSKLLEVIGRCILSDINLQVGEIAAISELVDLNTAFQLWNNIVSGPLPACLQNETQQTLRSVSCDCLSTIPSQVFEKFNKKQQVLCITLLLGLADDDDPNVRGAAIRCLGVYSLFPCLREDLSFLSDVANVLVEAVKDSSFNVRSKASWALGNLSDALLLSRDQWPEFANEITPSFLCSLGLASIEAAQDCDRVRANAVRALGNFLHYLPSHFLEIEQMKNFVNQAQTSLLSALSASVMKVRWNSCYALGNLLKNTSLINSDLLKVVDILTSLLSVLDCTNFKVRINATLALSLLPRRQIYGNLFARVWLQLVAALSAAQSDVDFRELKHHENLCDQVCFSLCQLAALIQFEDIDCLAENTLDAGEILLTRMWKFGERTKEDKITVVRAASDHLSILSEMETHSVKAKQFLSLLQDVLGQANVAWYQQEPG